MNRGSVLQRPRTGKSLAARHHGVAATLVIAAAFVSLAAMQQQAPRQWRLSDAPNLTAGDPGGPPSELFTRISGAVRLSSGGYVVADWAEQRLAVIDASGRFQSVFGREGAGPGEFKRLMGLWITGRDTIATWDAGALRITRFLPDGTVIRTDRLAYGGGSPPVSGGSLDPFAGGLTDGRFILAWLVLGPREPNQLRTDRLTFGLFSETGEFQQIVGAAPGMIRLFTRSGGGPHAFSPFPYFAIVQDTLVYSDGTDGEIHFFDPAVAGDQPARTLTAAGPDLSLRQAWNALEPVLATSKIALMVSIARDTDRSIGVVPRFARMFADDQNQLWLKEYDPARDAIALGGSRFVTGGRWQIIRTDGTPVARITMPDGVAPIGIAGDQLLGIARDALDVETFVVYRILK